MDTPRHPSVVLNELGEVVGIKWRIEQHHIPDYKGSCKLDPCVYCLAPSETWEHIQPKSKGGADGWSNLARACSPCNLERNIEPFLFYIMRKYNGR